MAKQPYIFNIFFKNNTDKAGRWQWNLGFKKTVGLVVAVLFKIKAAWRFAHGGTASKENIAPLREILQTQFTLLKITQQNFAVSMAPALRITDKEEPFYGNRTLLF